MNVLKRASRAAGLGTIQFPRPGWVRWDFQLNQDFPAFRGHFPGYPLLPAFVQVLLSIVVMEEVKKTQLEVLAVDNAKFQKELRPGAIVTVECRETAALPLLAFQVRIADQEGAAASFSVKCREIGTPRSDCS